MQELISAIRRYHQNCPTTADNILLATVNLRPLTGGYNNAVYAFEQDGQFFCAKLYQRDERQRDRREWQALNLMSQQNFPYHPQPIFYEADNLTPVVVMAYLPGQNMGWHNLTANQLDRLFELLAAMYQLTPTSTTARLEPTLCFGNPAYTLARLQKGLQAKANHRQHPASRAAYDWLSSFLGSGEALQVVTERVDQVFAKGDGNLSNYLWDGANLRTIDFEYSGWSDRAYDLADLLEHDQSHGTPDQTWQKFIERFNLAEAEQLRLERSRRMLAATWLLKFWPDEDAPPGQDFLHQLDRVHLLS